MGLSRVHRLRLLHKRAGGSRRVSVVWCFHAQVLGVRYMFAGEKSVGRLPVALGRMPGRSLNI